MGLFSFLYRRNNKVDFAKLPSDDKPDIPEEVFVQRDGDTAVNPEVSKQKENGINHLFQFLERDYVAKGYDDALINPDMTHLQHNTESLQNDPQRTIRKVKTFYEDFIREINFHIASRSRSGMIDTVEELNSRKETAEEHVKQVVEIESESLVGKGVGQSIVISYTRGFKNGLAAISHHKMLSKDF